MREGQKRREKGGETERKKERERENVYKRDVKRRKKNNILIIAWYEQNCDILLYNFAEEMREI